MYCCKYTPSFRSFLSLFLELSECKLRLLKNGGQKAAFWRFFFDLAAFVLRGGVHGLPMAIFANSAFCGRKPYFAFFCFRYNWHWTTSVRKLCLHSLAHLTQSLLYSIFLVLGLMKKVISPRSLCDAFFISVPPKKKPAALRSR